MISPLVPVSPKDLKDKRFIISPLVPSLIQGTKDYKPNLETNIDVLREILLENYRKKQHFRVTIGKSKWIDYEVFSPDYNLREILNDEIVIEFDNTDKETSWKATMLTLFNLVMAGIVCEVWDHKGRSPHIHIHNLPIGDLDADKRRLFKKMFIRKYVPLEYLKYVDYSLTGIHLVRIEYTPCWKGKYDIKRLIQIYDPVNDLELNEQIKQEKEWRE